MSYTFPMHMGTVVLLV